MTLANFTRIDKAKLWNILLIQLKIGTPELIWQDMYKLGLFYNHNWYIMAIFIYFFTDGGSFTNNFKLVANLQTGFHSILCNRRQVCRVVWILGVTIAGDYRDTIAIVKQQSQYYRDSGPTIAILSRYYRDSMDALGVVVGAVK